MENLTGGTPPVRYLPCVVPCKLYFAIDEITADEQGQANQKANHFSPPLFIHHNVLEQKDATPLAFRPI